MLKGILLLRNVSVINKYSRKMGVMMLKIIEKFFSLLYTDLKTRSFVWVYLVIFSLARPNLLSCGYISRRDRSALMADRDYSVLGGVYLVVS